MNAELETYLKEVRDIPAMPHVAAEVVRVVEQGDVSAVGLRRIIERDPGIAARVLKVANSALYGFTRQIDTLDHALALLGLHAVRNLVLAASLRQVFARFGLMEKLLFEHSTTCGPVARRLARELSCGAEPEEAFVAGLLHDLGKIVLANSHRTEYEAVVARTYNQRIGFVEAERAAFGFHHGELGGEVARRWQLAPIHEQVIRYHHEPQLFGDLEPAARNMTALVGIASACLVKLGYGRRCPTDVIEPDSLGCWEALSLSTDDVDDIVAICSEEAQKARALSE
jgi:putative nucleotidyltransferase with HDIG domain